MRSKLTQRLKIKFEKFLGYLVLFLVVLLALSLIRNVRRVMAIRGQVENQKGKVEKLKKEIEELQKKVGVVKSQEFLEKELRDKLGLVKEGEVVVVLPDEETLKKLAPKIFEEEETLPDPNWRRWLKLFL